MEKYFLLLIVLLPVAGCVPIWVLPKTADRAIRWTALLVMVGGTGLGVVLWNWFDPALGEMQLVTKQATWFRLNEIMTQVGPKGMNVHFQFGVDGISLLLVELVLLLGPLVILSSWSAVKERVKEYHLFMLLLQTGMLGALLAADLIVFYVFWELMLVPMYFLIGVWGGGRKLYAAIKFFLFSMAGSVLMLVAIIYLAYLPELRTFDIVTIVSGLNSTPLEPRIQYALFAAFAISFAIKVPMFPLHTWLPDAHVEAPTAGSVILAGVLLKMGTYGFIRFAMPFFPYAVQQSLPIIWGLALIGIIYGALVAMVQADVKKLVAYSSISHLGFVMLGLFALTEVGIQGALLQMVNHGLSTGALFLLVGVLYERRHTHLISEFGGLSKSMPRFAVFFMIVTLSSIGLPGLNGFVSEFLILAGTYTAPLPHAKLAAGLAATGVILAAAYMLWMFQRVMFGPITRAENKSLADLNGRELIYLAALLAFIVWIGVYPKPFLSRSEASVKHFITSFDQGLRRTEDFVHARELATQPPDPDRIEP